MEKLESTEKLSLLQIETGRYNKISRSTTQLKTTLIFSLIYNNPKLQAVTNSNVNSKDYYIICNMQLISAVISSCIDMNDKLLPNT